MDDLITGTDASETLYGYDGNDMLIGGGGSDTLTGGSGSDVFLFDFVISDQGWTTDNSGWYYVTSYDGTVDYITDFNSVEDSIIGWTYGDINPGTPYGFV